MISFNDYHLTYQHLNSEYLIEIILYNILSKYNIYITLHYIYINFLKSEKI